MYVYIVDIMTDIGELNLYLVCEVVKSGVLWESVISLTPIGF